MPPELPQDVLGKITRSLRPFMAAELEIEALMSSIMVTPNLTKRQFSRLHTQAHQIVDQAIGQAQPDWQAAIKLAYVRGARSHELDFTLGENEDQRVALFQDLALDNLRLSHLMVDRQMRDLMRRIQLVNVDGAMAPLRKASGAPPLADALPTASRRPWSLLQHARMALAATGTEAFLNGIKRTANQPV